MFGSGAGRDRDEFSFNYAHNVLYFVAHGYHDNPFLFFRTNIHNSSFSAAAAEFGTVHTILF